MVAIYQEQGIIFTRKTELELEKITVLVKKNSDIYELEKNHCYTVKILH